MVKIEPGDKHRTIALKIYNTMEVGEMVQLLSFVIILGEREELGRLVIKELQNIWNVENQGQYGAEVLTKPRSSVGGYLATKIFKYHRIANQHELKWSVWRIQ